MEGWNKYLSKNVKIFFDDQRSVSFKSGFLLFLDDNFIFIRSHNEDIAIPKSRVIRIEILRVEFIPGDNNG